ncbi:MAG TPA: hypothetical protein VHC72_11115 [Bryobacteraceae bacterium]|nr:hypothetical protein [Bryobacteraceae bacterium]
MIAAVIIAAGVVLALAEFVLWWRSHSRSYDSQNAESWLEEFSSAAYHPMIRLAEPNDAGFLAAQRGFDEAARYRRWQRQALRTYLRRLARDFQHLHTLAAAAPWRRLKFLLSVWKVEVRIAFSSVLPKAIDLRPLLVSLDDLAAQARSRRHHQI